MAKEVPQLARAVLQPGPLPVGLAAQLVAGVRHVVPQVGLDVVVALLLGVEVGGVGRQELGPDVGLPVQPGAHGLRPVRVQPVPRSRAAARRRSDGCGAGRGSRRPS